MGNMFDQALLGSLVTGALGLCAQIIHKVKFRIQDGKCISGCMDAPLSESELRVEKVQIGGAELLYVSGGTQ